jgi:transcriptional regulator with XRE-family HTH domain
MKANQDLRDYMADHGVTQGRLASEVGVSRQKLSYWMKKEMSPKDKEFYLKAVDSIVADRNEEPHSDEVEETDVVSCSTKFQIGDRVKIPAKQDVFGVVSDIWSSLAQDRTMYEVSLEINGTKGLYAEDQLELAPLPISYRWEAHIEDNVAVVAMIATQGEKTWVYSRGHAHILHDGEVGMAQAISYAARRMFEKLDTQQENKIYFK